MGLFGRRSGGERGGFWENPPVRTTDAQTLYSCGVSSLSQGDGKSTVAVGWALADVHGLHAHQASDFLTDGYSAWRDGHGFDPREAEAFLEALLTRLAANPRINGDIWSLPPDQVQPVATHYQTRCWAAAEILTLGEPSPEREERCYQAIVESPDALVPPRSIGFAKAYADRHGRRPPW